MFQFEHGLGPVLENIQKHLLNLIPVGAFDGGRGFGPLNIGQRWLVLAVAGACWYFSNDGILVVIIIFGFLRVFGAEKVARPDHRAMLRFIILLVALTTLSAICTSAAAPPPQKQSAGSAQNQEK